MNVLRYQAVYFPADEMPQMQNLYHTRVIVAHIYGRWIPYSLFLKRNSLCYSLLLFITALLSSVPFICSFCYYNNHTVIVVMKPYFIILSFFYHHPQYLFINGKKLRATPPFC